MKILEIEPGSPLFGYVRPGYAVVAVNGQPVQDSIDFRYRASDQRVHIVFADPDGKRLDYTFYDTPPGELGLTLDDRKVRTCKNDCIFCFIRQQPQGMRRPLYIKDEDYRLSFTHGNFITLSNTTEEDIERIIEQRLSPLYISVHATDDRLRRCMLRNEKLAPIVPRLRLLAENGIMLHTQVVLCPGINDGRYLEKTVDDLAGLYPSVSTLAVVPVGLTKYRENLPELRTYTADEARDVIAYVGKRQHEFLQSKGTRFVWCADEFYVQAELPFPPRAHYEVMEQFENGIGMVREFIGMFRRRRSRLKGLRSNKRALMLTGASAHPFLSKEIMPYITDELGLSVELLTVPNQFWGESVTVSGLLTGQDLLRFARARLSSFDTLVLPPNCLNRDDLFLDNLPLQHFSQALGKPVVIGQYNLAATLRELFS